MIRYGELSGRDGIAVSGALLRLEPTVGTSQTAPVQVPTAATASPQAPKQS